MYWQVYLHKTVVAAEMQLVYLLKRAKELAMQGEKLFATPALAHFLEQNISKENFENDTKYLELFSQLDDFDITTSIKVWAKNGDTTLAYLANSIINRRLPKIIIQNTAFTIDEIEEKKQEVKQQFKINNSTVDYYVFSGSVHNNAYTDKDVSINLLQKNGKVIDIALASDNYNFPMLQREVEKFYLCYPK